MGIRSLLGQIQDPPEPEPTQDEINRVALALHQLTDASELQITLNDLVATTGIPILPVIRVVNRLERRRLARIRPWQQERLAPVDWLKATTAEQLHLMGKTVVEMTAFLPSMLEGQLDYSPLADEAIVAPLFTGVDVEDLPHPNELIARVSLPRRRARDAMARYARGPIDAGIRLRVTVDITFPEMTVDERHDNSLELIAQLIEAIAANTAVRCEDVRLRSSETISLSA